MSASTFDLRDLKRAFTPNAVVSPMTARILVTATILVLFAGWWVQPVKLLPNPLEVVKAIPPLWFTFGGGQELIKSFLLNLEALAWTTVISLALSYLTVIAAFQPIIEIISKLRFASMVGLTLIFMVLTNDGHQLKLWMLVFGETVFFVTTMASNVKNVLPAKQDHARTLRMGEWHVVWEVTILGHRHEAIETLRQVAAIGWVMLTMVEGVVRSEGGIGAIMLNMDRQMKVDMVFAIQLLILSIGLFTDLTIGFLNTQLAPYAKLKQKRGSR